jgi:hypothetical protein
LAIRYDVAICAGSGNPPSRRTAAWISGSSASVGQGGLGSHKGCPPGQAAGPAGQLLAAAAPILCQGRAARTAQAARDWLGQYGRRGSGGLIPSRRWGPGNPEGAPRWIEGTPAAAQPLGGLAGVSVQEPLELLGAQGPHRQATALIHRRPQRLQILLARVGVGVLAHVLLPSAN